MKKFYIVNLIIFVVLLLTFITGFNTQNEIRYTFAGNSFLNAVSGQYINYNGMILQVFAGLGMIVQLIMVNLKMMQDFKK